MSVLTQLHFLIVVVMSVLTQLHLSPNKVLPTARTPQPPVAPTPMPAHPAAHDTSATNRGSPGDIETLASWQIPTAQNWPELKRLLTGPAQRVIVLSPDKSFFAVAPTIMEKFLRTAQYTIAMGLNSHMAYFTLDPSDIPTARSQTERTRLFRRPFGTLSCLRGWILRR